MIDGVKAQEESAAMRATSGVPEPADPTQEQNAGVNTEATPAQEAIPDTGTQPDVTGGETKTEEVTGEVEPGADPGIEEAKARAARFQTDLQDLRTGVDSLVPGLAGEIISIQRERPTTERFNLDPNAFAPLAGSLGLQETEPEGQTTEDQDDSFISNMSQTEFRKLMREENQHFRTQQQRANNVSIASQEFAQVEKKLNDFKTKQNLSDAMFNQVISMVQARTGVTVETMQTIPGISSRFLQSFGDYIELISHRQQDQNALGLNGSSAQAQNAGNLPSLDNVTQPATTAPGSVVETKLTPVQEDIKRMKRASPGNVLDQLLKQGTG